MYWYAYIEHSAACFKGRQHLVTPSLAQSPMAVPALSSVAQCAKFYSDCLTTRQRCGLWFRRRIAMAGGVGMQWHGFCDQSFGAPRPLQRLHTFSCECDGAKQTWLQENFPEVPLIFEDICELHTGRASHILTGDESDAPDVDLFVAGFVCKSVSTENTQRQ